MFPMAIGKAKKCLAGCQVTNCNCTKCHSVLTAWVFQFVKKIGWTCCIEALCFSNRIMVHVSRFLVLHLDSDQWKHFILNILLLVGGDATHIFTSILLLHALHTLDHNCTCQINPRLSFGLFWWCGRLFFFSLHTIILHMCASFHLTHYHSSNIFIMQVVV